MKRECEIVKDLLPLYAENLCSQTSADFVSNHTALCTECQALLIELRKPTSLVPDTKAETLRILRARLRKRIILSVLTAIMILLTLLAGVVVSATVPVWLSVDEAIVYAEQQPDGSVKVKLTDRVCHITSFDNDRFCCQGVRVNWFLTITRAQIPNNGEHILTFQPSDESALWYCGQYTGEPDTKLWDPDTTTTENSYFRQMDRSLLHILCISALVGGIFLICGIFLRKKPLGRWLLVVAALFICCIISTVFVTGGHFYDTAIRNAALLKYSTLVKRYIAIAVMTIISFAATLFAGMTIFEYRRN